MTLKPVLVDIKELEPGIVVDIRYATRDNHFKEAVYPSDRCWLVRPAAERLVRVHRALKARDFGIKVWDCYRPLSVQRRLWELNPDPTYVAPPEKGSNHNRGAAVDVILADDKGREVEMPTDYDDFSERARRDWSGASAQAKKNRALLESAMKVEGFIGLPQEWWHYDDPDCARYPLLDILMR